MSPKLERYLLTIARRGDKENISVSVVLIYDGEIVMEGNHLPSEKVGRDGICAALKGLLKKLDVTGEPRYSGHFDMEKTQRQYNFTIVLDEKPPLGAGFSFRDASEAVGLLDHKYAKLIAGPFTKPPAVDQMLAW